MPAERTAASSSTSARASPSSIGGLSYPASIKAQSAENASTRESDSTEATSSAIVLSDRRLFVGNLAPAITEYDLLVLFQPHGKLTKLDLVFHRQGPDRGKPKGFAFVELATPEQATRARLAVDGKLVKGRELRVRYATVADSNDASEHGSRQLGAPRPGAQRHPLQSSSRPSRGGGSLSSRVPAKKPASVDDRIAAMEAKLAGMRQAKEQKHPDAKATDTVSAPGPSSKAHPSLPDKPSGRLPHR